MFGAGGLILKNGLLRWAIADKADSLDRENIAGIATLGAAVELLSRIGFDVIEEYERILITTALLSELAQLSGVKVYGIFDPSHPNFHRMGGVASFSFDELSHGAVSKSFCLGFFFA